MYGFSDFHNLSSKIARTNELWLTKNDIQVLEGFGGYGGVGGGAQMSQFGKKWPFSLDFGLILAHK